jgi:peptidoglycan hydrolase-like protein with peptidoglycan-binding domain
MQKDFYLKELQISSTQKRSGADNKKKDVEKIQSWLTLYSIANPGSATTTSIDGDFGPATERTVMNFQKAKNLPQTGIVEQNLFDRLCDPMKIAFTESVKGNNLRQRIVNVARQHAECAPYELVIHRQSNCGPWVRSYMDGHEGTEWFWCMGFVQAIIDQAASSFNKSFTDIMPLTYSCDTVGTTGLANGNLFRFEKVRKDPALVKPGDIFLVQKTLFDWIHAGIIVSVNDGIFETIEGNSNDGGSNNGNRVCRRIRNYQKSKLDVFSVEGLVTL